MSLLIHVIIDLKLITNKKYDYKLNHVVIIMQVSNDDLENNKLRDYIMPLFFMVLVSGITTSQTKSGYQSN